MKVLIVEDIEFRQELIKEKIEIEDVDCTQYGDKGFELLANKSYDLVFLDHDLIGAKSGSYLTKKWYEKTKSKDSIFMTQKPIVIIHSMNLMGASIMENYLKGLSKVTERIPFKLIVTDKIDLKKEIERLKAK